MTNNKLSPVTVYVPVSVKDDSPKENESVFVFTEGYGGNIVAEYKNLEYIDPNLLEEGTGKPVDASEFVTHFLKEQSKYVFDRDELEKLLSDARKEMADNILRQIAQTFLNPSNQNKA